MGSFLSACNGFDFPFLQASAMGYKSVKAFLSAERKEAAAARAEAVKEEETRAKVTFCICFVFLLYYSCLT